MAITDTAPRVQYTVGGSAQTAFTVNFRFFAEGDLVVYDGTTQLTYAASPSDATEYSVSGAGEASGGTVTLGGSGVTNTTITIVRDVPVARSTDFPASGPFQIDSLNDELDKFAAMIAERETQITRTLSAPDTDPTGIDMALPAKADRLGKYLQFNSTTGLPEAGPNSADVTALADVATDIATLADIEDGTVATNAIQTVGGISGNVTTVAGISSDVTAVAGDSTEIGTVATNLTGSNTIGTVAGISADVTTVAGISSNVTTVAGISSDVTTVAADGTDIGTVAGISSDVTTVAGISSDVTTVAADGTDIGTVAGISADVTSVAGVAANVSTVAGVSADVTTVAGISADVTVAATNVADITNFADVYIGPSASDPTQRADTSALQAGDLYFNTGSNSMKVYNGSSWDSVSVSAATVVSKTSSTGSAVIPVGSTGDRDGSPSTGFFRYNTTESQFEGYDGSAWGQIGGGAGYFKGENGTVGSSAGDIFRVNEQELNTDVTIASTENASATGPLSVASGTTLTVDGNLSII